MHRRSGSMTWPRQPLPRLERFAFYLTQEHHNSPSFWGEFWFKINANRFNRLDDGFFKVRLERLTPKEREYVVAVARLGKGPYRSADVADMMGEKSTALGPRRASIIAKGMIYSPAHGDIAFTVPMFEQFLARHHLAL